MQVTNVHCESACRQLELLHAQSIIKASMHHIQGDMAGTVAAEAAWEHTCCNADVS